MDIARGLGLLILFTGVTAAQSADLGGPRYLSSLWSRRITPDATASDARTAALGSERGDEFDLAFQPATEDLSLRLSSQPYPIARETLDGEGEGLHRFDGLPGGIVLGLTAEVPAELRGARLCRVERGALALRLDDAFGGGVLALPELAPAKLRSCAAFVADGLDGLVDLTHDTRTEARLAPSFAGGELGELLVRMDGVPHRLVPRTKGWKTMIVDRRVEVGLRGGVLAFAADLEVRCYADDVDGSARRVLVIGAGGPDFVGPRMSDDLGAELSPLAELAGWLGFLRWAAIADPAGFAALR